MVGKWRLNKRHRGPSKRREMLSRRRWRDDSPFVVRARPEAGWPGVVDGKIEALSLETVHFDALNQERSASSSIGRRSDCQSRKTPPTRNARSASQTPAAGETRPWRAKDTPIKEIE